MLLPKRNAFFLFRFSAEDLSSTAQRCYGIPSYWATSPASASTDFVRKPPLPILKRCSRTITHTNVQGNISHGKQPKPRTHPSSLALKTRTSALPALHPIFCTRLFIHSILCPPLPPLTKRGLRTQRSRLRTAQRITRLGLGALRVQRRRIRRLCVQPRCSRTRASAYTQMARSVRACERRTRLVQTLLLVLGRADGSFIRSSLRGQTFSLFFATVAHPPRKVSRVIFLRYRSNR